VPMQLAQCWFPGLAISNDKKYIIVFSNKIYGSNFIKLSATDQSCPSVWLDWVCIGRVGSSFFQCLVVWVGSTIAKVMI